MSGNRTEMPYPPERMDNMSSSSGDSPGGIRYRRLPGPLRDISAGLAAATAIFVAVCSGVVLVIAGTTAMRWVLAQTGERAAVSAGPILAGVALFVLIGMLWGIYRVARQVYRFTAVALFRILSTDALAKTDS